MGKVKSCLFNVLMSLSLIRERKQKLIIFLLLGDWPVKALELVHPIFPFKVRLRVIVSSPFIKQTQLKIESILTISTCALSWAVIGSGNTFKLEKVRRVQAISTASSLCNTG